MLAGRGHIDAPDFMAARLDQRLDVACDLANVVLVKLVFSHEDI